ncbi:hypothetical protein [Mesoterricola silvestris]|uniref:ParB/Sulfiredoxin domain-containing protein n=1 Tax=Mesoterricola silvestris TaxID=2927979 RepID=A0AA48GGP3_9BACT|nr:hypothetical protein [Mesoterricola silvestris]BDU70857.1 hypothetical protein METEAL_00310 [Mesoterricola silvestris]
MTFQEDTITIRKKEIKVKTGYMPQLDLRFFPENPRIYSMVWAEDGEVPTQEEIFNALSKSEHVRETLVPSIKANGGLIEPVLVRKNVVLEGNSRLAAFRLLYQVDPKAWVNIRVKILPDGITDSEVFSLLGEFHIVGKKDWAPFEQAGYLYRRFKLHGVPEDQLHQEVGIGKAKIQHLIRVYQYMLDKGDKNPDRWSYYDELLKGRKFDKARALYPGFDERITGMIQDGSISRAVDVRDNLSMVVKVGGNTLKKFMNGGLTFDGAVEDARLRGAGSYYVTKFSDFRKWLADDHLDAEISSVSEKEKGVLEYELSRIEKRIKQIAHKLKPSTSSN